MYNGGQYLLDGLDVWTEYGLVVTSGKGDLLKFPVRKEPLSYDWQDENGKEWDLTAAPVYEDPQVTLEGYIIAKSEADFLIKRYKLWVAINKTGTRQLNSLDMTEVFKFFYISMSQSDLVSRRVKGTDVKCWFVSITLQLIDFITKNPEVDVLGLDENTILGDSNNNILQIS